MRRRRRDSTSTSMDGGRVSEAPFTLMGVVTVTPDSFSDGGRFLHPGAAIQQGMRLVREGAEILDVGGESTRPGAEPVSADEEIARVLPVIQGLVGAFEGGVRPGLREGAALPLGSPGTDEGCMALEDLWT